MQWLCAEYLSVTHTAGPCFDYCWRQPGGTATAVFTYCDQIMPSGTKPLSELKPPYDLWGHPSTVHVKRILVSDSVIGFQKIVINTTYILIRGKWVNSRWPCDAIWRRESGPALVRVVTCFPDDTKPLPERCWSTMTQVVRWHLDASD